MSFGKKLVTVLYDLDTGVRDNLLHSERRHTWCARQIRSISCFCRNRDTTSGPKVNDTPLSFSDQPVMSLSGSDHKRSHSSPIRGRGKPFQRVIEPHRPVSGTSVGRITLRICSMDCRSGLRPPCIVKIFSSMMAAIGRQLKQSVNVFHNLMLYRRLPAKQTVKPSTEKIRRRRTFVVKPVYSVDARTFVISS